MHDARTKLAPGRRARGAPALPVARLRHGDPAQRPARRGAELRPPRHPSRPALRRLGGLLRAGQGGGRAWLSATRGMGRGLAAILSSTAPTSRRGGRPRAAPAPGRADRAQPAPAAAAFDEDALVGAGRLAARARRPAARARAPAARRHLRADRRRAPLARRAAGRARGRARRRARRRRRDVARARADREHGPRGPQPGRGGARLRRCSSRSSGSRARTSAAGSAARASRCRTCCGCSTCPTRCSTCWSPAALTEGHGRALLMAPDHGDRRRLARAAADAGLDRARDREPRARGGGPPRAHAGTRRGAPSRGPPGPGRGGRAARRRVRRGARRATSGSRPAGTATRSRSRFESLDEALGARRAPRRRPTPRADVAIIAPPGD